MMDQRLYDAGVAAFEKVSYGVVLKPRPYSWVGMLQLKRWLRHP